MLKRLGHISSNLGRVLHIPESRLGIAGGRTIVMFNYLVRLSIASLSVGCLSRTQASFACHLCSHACSFRRQISLRTVASLEPVVSKSPLLKDAMLKKAV